MSRENADAAALDSRRAALAAALTERHFAAHPELRERYGEIGYTKCLEDANYHLRYLAESLRAGEPALFIDYVRWARVMLEARNVPREDLERNLQLLAGVLREEMPGAVADRGIAAIEAAVDALDDLRPSSPFVSPDAAHGDLATAYLQALLRGDRRAASQLVTNAWSSGRASIRDLYLNVFQPVQYEIGRLWQVNAITVADEHFCTAATQVIMSQFYPELFALPKKGKTLVMAAVGGELHEIGARMVADLFELEGWSTWYYGANTPTASLIAAICEKKPQVVGISVTMTFHVAALTEFLRQMRANPGCSHARVLVGGYPFKVAPSLWKEIGADGFAPDAAAAVELAERLTSAP